MIFLKGQTNFEELMMRNADKVIDGEEIEMDFFNIKAFSTETIKSWWFFSVKNKNLVR